MKNLSLLVLTLLVAACGSTSNQSFEVPKCGYSVLVENVSKVVHIDSNLYRKRCLGTHEFYVPIPNPNIVPEPAPTCGFSLNADGTLVTYNDLDTDLRNRTLVSCQ